MGALAVRGNVITGHVGARCEHLGTRSCGRRGEQDG